MKTKHYYIYAYLCIITAKIYIGWAISPKRRWRVHYNSKDGTYFHNAIQKYGGECFERFIIDYSLSLKEIKQKEKDLIGLFNTYKDGYNQTKGGDGSNGCYPSEETRKKMKGSQKGKNKGEDNPFYGKHHSEECRKNQSEKMQGTHHSKETIEKIKAYKHTEEAVEKMKIAGIGNQNAKGKNLGKDNPMKNPINVLKMRFTTLKTRIKNLEKEI